MMGGLWIKILHGVPLVITTHSLEPLRPWKEEQLGRGYHLSRWIEKTAIESADAVIAVSEGTRKEVLECYELDSSKVRVIHNGIDLDIFRRTDPKPALEKYKLPTGKPYLLFVGRITRQKGVLHLVRALEHATRDLDAILCAGAPDTKEIGREMAERVAAVSRRRGGVVWLQELLPREELIQFYSHAAVFCCPSVYEPFGIINLEAMACSCPVVASKVGGIPEAVADGETGILVPFESKGPPSYEPKDPDRFARDLAAAVNELAKDPALRTRMGEAGRRRVEEKFSWGMIARRTLELYGDIARAAGR
jgi:starch synthase